MNNQQSKEKRDIFDRIMALPGLCILEPFYKAHKEVLLYIFFGGLTTVISIGSYGLLLATGMSALVANIYSWILAVLFAYVTNSIWVFDSHAQTLSQRLREVVSFYGGRVATLVMEELILLIFVEILGLHAMIIKIAAQVLVMVLNYVISKWIVFR